MEHSYTENKLVQFIYGECDLLETLEIEDAIENNTFMKESYLSILDAYRMLPRVKFSPSGKTIESILAYSKKSCGAEC
jgi:hypothetical protein